MVKYSFTFAGLLSSVLSTSGQERGQRVIFSMPISYNLWLYGMSQNLYSESCSIKLNMILFAFMAGLKIKRYSLMLQIFYAVEK